MAKRLLYLAALFVIAGCQASVPAPEPVSSATAPEAGTADAAAQSYSAPAYYYFTAAQLKLKEGDINEASWLIQQAIRFDPESVYLKLELANLLLIKKEDAKALSLVEEILSSAPDHAEALSLAGQIYQQQGKTDKALVVYEKVIDLQPDDQNIYLIVGRVYWNRNDLDNAERVFHQMTTNMPESYAAYYFYGKVLAAQGKSAEAEQALIQSLELEPGIEEPLIELLAIYKRQNRPAKVAETYQSMIQLNPNDYKAVFGLAQHHHQHGQKERSLELLMDLASQIEKDNRVIATLFEMYLEKKQFKDAIWAIEGMLKQVPGHADLHYMAGMAHDGIQDNHKALEHMLKVTPGSRFYTNAVVHSALLYHDKGEINRAIDVVQKALEHAPDHVDYYLYLGSFYEELERFDDALTILREGMRRDTKNARIYFRLGVVLDKMGRKQESIAAMKRVLVLTPDDAEALNYLGYTYADLGINLDEAESLIQAALELKPDDGYITDSLGWVYYKRGNYLQALEWLTKAVKLVPDDPTILEHLGDVYRKMERKEKALEYYMRSLKKRDNGRDSLQEKIRMLDKN